MKKKQKPPDIGWLEVCLNVKDIKASREFYQTLGFEIVGGNEEEKWLVMELNGSRISLFQGHIDENLLNFRGGDIFEIAEYLKAKGKKLVKDAFTADDGGSAAEALDPDGNVVYFNTFPGETRATRK